MAFFDKSTLDRVKLSARFYSQFNNVIQKKVQIIYLLLYFSQIYLVALEVNRPEYFGFLLESDSLAFSRYHCRNIGG